MNITLKTTFGFSLTVLVLLLVMVSISSAQLPPPEIPVGPSQAPLDGVSILAISGGMYVLKKLRKRTLNKA